MYKFVTDPDIGPYARVKRPHHASTVARENTPLATAVAKDDASSTSDKVVTTPIGDEHVNEAVVKTTTDGDVGVEIDAAKSSVKSFFDNNGNGSLTQTLTRRTAPIQ